MDKLIVKVTTIASRITKFLENAKRTGKEKRTDGFLSARIQLLKNYWSNYQNLHDMMYDMATAEELKDSYFVDDTYSDVECAYAEAMGWLCDELESLNPPDRPVQNSKPTTYQHVELPKVNIPTFAGSYLDWPSFRDTYTSLIHANQSLSEIQKMHYLKSAVSGDAAKLLNHLSITSTNYLSAWETLTNRYENTRLLVNSYLTVLTTIPIMSTESANEIRRILDNFTQALRALENLDRPTKHWDDWLVFILANKLDNATRKDWENSISSVSEVPSFQSLQTFLVGRLHTLDAIKGVQKSERKVVQGNRPRYNALTHHISTTKSCVICQGKHILMFCPVFKAKSTQQRTEIVQHHKLCLNCLKLGHNTYACPSINRCKHCSQKHHSMLHQGNVAVASNSEVATSIRTDSNLSLSNNPETSVPTKAYISGKISTTTSVLLATAIVSIQSPNGRTIRARALLDQGAESSFITASLANMLRLPRQKVRIPVIGVGGCEAGIAESSVRYDLISTTKSAFTCTVQALVLSNLTSLLPSRPIPRNEWPHIRGIELADPDYYVPSRIDLILGAEVYSNILLSEIRRGPSGSPIAQETTLGWILFGAIHSNSDKSSSAINLHCTTTGDDLNDLLRRFWELDTIRESSRLTPDEEKCENFFKSTYKRDIDGRYSVKLPVKQPNVKLGESKHLATAALLRMERRFTQNQELHNLYKDFMDEYLDLNHMELLPDDTQNVDRYYYLPHHAVLKPSSTTTKLRVVFNASQQTRTGVSLNAILHTGPKLQNDVAVIMMKWRVHPYVFSADIEKMYRQIRIDPGDTDLQRIVWRQNPTQPIKSYRLLTVTYGTASAPYLACRTLLQLAEDYSVQFPLGTRILRENFYVDDALFGAFDQTSAVQARNEIRNLLLCGGFKLRKWLSNNQNLLVDIPDEDKELCSAPRLLNDDQIKTLGIYWNPSVDQFSYQIMPTDNKRITKRNILSEVSCLYDPMGWLSPVTITAKIFLQKLWCSRLDWDDDVPSEHSNFWITYRENLKDINSIYVDRWLGITSFQLALELHAFCDASTAAYGAVVYLRIVHDLENIQISLIAAKTKVSPLKSVSLPRLELCGAALLSQLVSSVIKALNLEDISVHAWTDSMVVLAWLTDHPSRWKTFVANRTSLIQQTLPTARWHHISSSENPADCLTRGLKPVQLKNHHLWWTGPNWLAKHSSQWPNNTIQSEKHSILEEKVQTLVCTAASDESSLELLHRFSSLTKLLIVSAYIRRFIHNARCVKKSERCIGVLSHQETDSALSWWLTTIQDLYFRSEITSLSKNSSISSKSKLCSLSPVLDSNRILRIGGRLKHSMLSFNQKHPIILPKDSHLTRLIIAHSHDVTLHGGIQLTLQHIRNRYWILDGRNKVRQYVRRCVRCFRYKAEAKSQIMSDLPAVRVRPSKPFLNSGVDYAGPIHVKSIKGRGGKVIKTYVAVFICLVTRAIHLELVMDLSAEAFLAAFKRFVARRGHCAHLYSDNATNFVASDKQLHQHLRKLMNDSESPINILLLKDGTEWHFIPPAAPHFGGIWEAGVKSLKYHLRRIIGDHLLSIEEMLTLLAKIEACLNSRPLHPLTDDPDDFSALTPGHFLIGESLLTIPEPSTIDISTNRLQRWQLVHHMVEQLWKRWYKEYVHHLQLRYKWTDKRDSVKINDLVLVKDDRVPPSKWILARITELHPGPDGNIRVVTIKHQGGFSKRPITKLCVLPISS